MESLIQFTPSTGPTASDDLESLFERHRLLCLSCPFKEEGNRCHLCRTCQIESWKRPRCPAGRWWDREYEEIRARLQPQVIDPE